MPDNVIPKKKRISLLVIYFGINLFLFQMIIEPWIYHSYGFHEYLITDALLNAFMLISFVLILNDWLKREWNAFCQNPKKAVLSVLLFFGLLLIVSYLFTYCIADPLHLSEAENQINNEKMMGINLYGFLLNTLFMAPFIEEIIFRGCIFYPLTRHGIGAAAFYSGFLFGSLHVVASVVSGNWMNLIYLIDYGMCGVVLALSVGKTKSIWTSVFVHALFNLFGVIGMFL